MKNEMNREAAIFYKLNRKVYTMSVSAKSTADMLQILQDELKLTVFGVIARNFQNVFLNNEIALSFTATKKRQYNSIVVRKSMQMYFQNLLFN